MSATAVMDKSVASSSLSFDALLAKARELSPFLSEQGVAGEKRAFAEFRHRNEQIWLGSELSGQRRTR